MAWFKCKNCESTFNKFCDTLEDTIDIECPNCKSHWVVLEGEEDTKANPFPMLPYSDPPYPQPWIGDPIGVPWPPSPYKFWCTKDKARRSDW